MTGLTRVSVGVLLLICLPRARRCGMFCDDLDLDSTFGRQVADSRLEKLEISLKPPVPGCVTAQAVLINLPRVSLILC